MVIESKPNYIIFKSWFSSYYIYIENNPYEVGDILYFTGTLNDVWFKNYESQFDFTKYLNDSFVYKEIKYTSVNEVFLSFFRIRSIISNNLNNYDEYAKIFLGKLLFNVNLDEGYSSLISENNLFYLLSISSIHLYLLNEFNRKLLKIKLKERTVDIIIIISNVILFFISNYKMTILKVFIFSLIYYLNEYHFKVKKNRFELISLCAFIILIIKPSYANSIGFLYSFSIPYFLLFINAALSTFKNKYRKYITILMIFIFLIPINLLNNSYFSLTSMILSQIFIPLIIPFFFLGIIGIFFPIYKLINFFGRMMYGMVIIISKLNINIYIGETTILFCFIFYALLICLIFFMENKRKEKIINVSLIMITILTFYSLPIKNKIISEVSFINVGQGASTLVSSDGLNVLIDTGGIIDIDIGKETLIPYFKKKRIKKLDYIFLTHQDYDHVGALSSLLNNFNVNDYNHNNNFTNIKVGNIEFKNYNPSLKNDDNDDSLVLEFTLKGNVFLIMGDASKEVEKRIIKNNDIKCDYILVGHHGSDTSTSDEFIKKVVPKEAIISCGRKNNYNHPSEKTLKTLKSNGVKIRRTDIEGTILYKFL